MAKFAVVEFMDDSAVAIICNSWFYGDEEQYCLWPNEPSSKVARLAKAEQEPCTTWTKHKIRVLGKAGNHERASEKLKLSEETSNLSTDAEEPSRKRRRIRNPRFVISDSEDDSDASDHVSPPSHVEEVPVVPASLVSGISPEDITAVAELAAIVMSPPTVVTQPMPSTSHQPPEPSTSTASAASERVRPNTLPTAAVPTHTPDDRTYLVGERLLRRILEIILNMQETLKVHSGMLQSLMKKVTGCTAEAAALPEGLNFPIDSIENLEELDTLLINPAVRGALVNVLGEIGGRNTDECVKRIMKFVVTNTVATKLNMCGRNGKKALGPTNLFEAVYRGIKRNVPTAEVTKKDVEKSVAKWLIGGRDRDGNRAKRGDKRRDP